MVPISKIQQNIQQIYSWWKIETTHNIPLSREDIAPLFNILWYWYFGGFSGNKIQQWKGGSIQKKGSFFVMYRYWEQRQDQKMMAICQDQFPSLAETKQKFQLSCLICQVIQILLFCQHHRLFLWSRGF